MEELGGEQVRCICVEGKIKKFVKKMREWSVNEFGDGVKKQKDIVEKK